MDRGSMKETDGAVRRHPEQLMHISRQDSGFGPLRAVEKKSPRGQRKPLKSLDSRKQMKGFSFPFPFSGFPLFFHRLPDHFHFLHYIVDML